MLLAAKYEFRDLPQVSFSDARYTDYHFSKAIARCDAPQLKSPVETIVIIDLILDAKRLH